MYLPKVQLLDERLRQWYERLVARRFLPSSMSGSSGNVRNTLHNAIPLLLLIHIVYHQSVCALHASVPLFVWEASGDDWTNARRNSAQAAFDHTKATTALLEAYMEVSPDATHLPAFIGYAAYCAFCHSDEFCVLNRSEHQNTNAEKRYRQPQSDTADRQVLEINCSSRQFSPYIAIILMLMVSLTICSRGSTSSHYTGRFCQNLRPLDNKPRATDGKRLSKCVADSTRVRASDLGYNSIVWRRQGGLAISDDDLTNLRLVKTSNSTLGPLDQGTFPAACGLTGPFRIRL